MAYEFISTDSLIGWYVFDSDKSELWRVAAYHAGERKYVMCQRTEDEDGTEKPLDEYQLIEVDILSSDCVYLYMSFEAYRRGIE